MYLKDSEDALLQIVREHDGRNKLFSIQKEANKFSEELNLPNLDKEHMNQQLNLQNKQNKRHNIRPKIFKKTSGKIRHSMASTQRE